MRALLYTVAIAVLILVIFTWVPAAQVSAPTTPVQHVAGHADAATKVVTTATSATTLTMQPDTGQSIYLYEIDLQNCAGGTAIAAAAVTTVSTTNIDGGLAWTIGNGATAGLCTTQVVQYPTGLKAQAANQPVTIVLPAFATNQTIRVNVAYRSAP